MISRPNSLKSLKKLTAQYPGTEEVYELIDSLDAIANDQYSAIAAAALLDGALKQALIKNLIVPEDLGEGDLFNSGAPLRAFSAKIKMGFALGLYGPKTRKDLDLIRDVRNSLAHAMVRLDFDTEQVANVCRRITLVDRVARTSGKIDFSRMALANVYLLSTNWLTMSFDAFGRLGCYPEPSKDTDNYGLQAALLDAIAQ